MGDKEKFILFNEKWEDIEIENSVSYELQMLEPMIGKLFFIHTAHVFGLCKIIDIKTNEKLVNVDGIDFNMKNIQTLTLSLNGRPNTIKNPKFYTQLSNTINKLRKEYLVVKNIFDSGTMVDD